MLVLVLLLLPDLLSCFIQKRFFSSKLKKVTGFWNGTVTTGFVAQNACVKTSSYIILVFSF